MVFCCIFSKRCLKARVQSLVGKKVEVADKILRTTRVRQLQQQWESSQINSAPLPTTGGHIYRPDGHRVVERGGLRQYSLRAAPQS